MKKLMTYTLALMMLVLMSSFTAAPPVEKKVIKIGWSIYAGWNPWQYGYETGIIKEWANKYNYKIIFEQMQYIPSIEAYTAGELAGCVMTNMDALTIPIAAGIPSTVPFIGSFSNGNDAIIVRDDITIQDLPNITTYLVRESVSEYLYSRAHDLNKMKVNPKAIEMIEEGDITSALKTRSEVKSVATWNPMVMECAQVPGTKKIFTSAEIPGEILDVLVLNSKVLYDNPGLGEALTGAWFEIMSIMHQRSAKADAAKAKMGEIGGSDLTEYKAQLRTTALFDTPSKALNYSKGAELQTNMSRVRNFCNKHRPEGAKDYNTIGIKFPDGNVVGNANNILLEFNIDYLEKAVNNQL